MTINRNKFRRVNQDRLSSLPDELIHKILSSFHMQFVVQTCLLSSRWKLVWTSMPCLNFSSEHFDGNLRKFSKFVNRVLSHRNKQIDVASVELEFSKTVSQVIVRKIADYAYSHNVQQLTVESWCQGQSYQLYRIIDNYPPCLFISQSLKHFTFKCPFSPNVTPKTPWDFPALTTLHLSYIHMCINNTQDSVDLFSKCVNLKNLTLYSFTVAGVGVFDIITPRLSSLMLTYGTCSEVIINLVAPQLEKLEVVKCSFKYMNAPPGLSSLYYMGDHTPLKLCEDRFHALNKATICLNPTIPYKKKDARKFIIMLQTLYSARYLRLGEGIVECLSTFPDLLLQHSSPFSNLICLCIDSGDEVNMSAEARNFFLDNSPNAEIIMD